MATLTIRTIRNFEVQLEFKVRVSCQDSFSLFMSHLVDSTWQVASVDDILSKSGKGISKIQNGTKQDRNWCDRKAKQSSWCEIILVLHITARFRILLILSGVYASRKRF